MSPMLTRSRAKEKEKAHLPSPGSSLSSASQPPGRATSVSTVSPVAAVASSSSDEFFSPPSTPPPSPRRGRRRGRGRPPAGLGPRGQQAPSRVPAAGGNVSRMRWTQSMNENVMRAYYGATEGGSNLTAYRGRMLSLFQVLEPAVSVDAQRLSDQVRVIQRNHMLDDIVLDRLRSESWSNLVMPTSPMIAVQLQNMSSAPPQSDQDGEVDDDEVISVSTQCNAQLRNALEDAVATCPLVTNI